jgi:CrcB protein
MLKDINLVNSIAIAIGAVPGALSRYYITEWCKKKLRH